jgi:hypothetical protein
MDSEEINLRIARRIIIIIVIIFIIIIFIIIINNFTTGDSDAYAIVCLNDLAGRPSKIEVFRTVEKRKTLTPEWNQTFEFGEWVDMEMMMMMIIIYMDRDRDDVMS